MRNENDIEQNLTHSKKSVLDEGLCKAVSKLTYHAENFDFLKSNDNWNYQGKILLTHFGDKYNLDQL